LGIWGFIFSHFERIKLIGQRQETGLEEIGSFVLFDALAVQFSSEAKCVLDRRAGISKWPSAETRPSGIRTSSFSALPFAETLFGTIKLISSSRFVSCGRQQTTDKQTNVSRVTEAQKSH
jgi:hypothetical protein